MPMPSCRPPASHGQAFPSHRFGLSRGGMPVPARIFLAVLAVALLAGPRLAAGDDPEPAVIARWIEELGSPQFARREAAAKSLAAAGEPAIGPLEAAVRQGDLEVASRGVEILRDLLGREPELAAAAEAALVRSAEDGGSTAARLAEATLEFYAEGTAAAAREQLESLGAVFVERPLVEDAGLEVVFGEGWTGTVADLRQLVRLPGLAAVGFHGVPLDRESLAVLGRLERLQQLELFGTGASDRDVAALAARLPAARIDVRQGGKLGVGALAFGGPCEVRTVEPGSAADQAGIRPGDVIQAVDDVPITDFEGLTARLAGRRPGERLRLAVVREGRAAGERERLELDVRLDAW